MSAKFSHALSRHAEDELLVSGNCVSLHQMSQSVDNFLMNEARMTVW